MHIPVPSIPLTILYIFYSLIQMITSPASHPKKRHPRKSQARLSMDDMVAAYSRPAPSKKHKKGASNQDLYVSGKVCSKKKQVRFHRQVIPFSATASPIKKSIEATRSQTPRADQLSSFKFCYQVGFGSLGRVWKVK